MLNSKTYFEKVEKAAEEVLSGNIKAGSVPVKWDGNTAERIVDIIASSQPQ